MKDEQRAEERRLALVKALANAICLVQSKNELFKYECDENEWNDDVIYLINDGIQKFGEALATLTVWNDDVEEK